MQSRTLIAIVLLASIGFAAAGLCHFIELIDKWQTLSDSTIKCAGRHSHWLEHWI
jgi:hypothetical protein